MKKTSAQTKNDPPAMQQKEPYAIQLARTLRALRVEKGWSQAVLAEKLSLQQSAISSLESGWANPRMDVLVAVAAALGVQPSTLLQDTKSGLRFYKPEETENITIADTQIRHIKWDESFIDQAELANHVDPTRQIYPQLDEKIIIQINPSQWVLFKILSGQVRLCAETPFCDKFLNEGEATYLTGSDLEIHLHRAWQKDASGYRSAGAWGLLIIGKKREGFGVDAYTPLA